MIRFRRLLCVECFQDGSFLYIMEKSEGTHAECLALVSGGFWEGLQPTAKATLVVG